MRVRQPAVAGMFYEGSAARLKAQVEECLAGVEGSETFLGAVVPHAGLMYSGHVAGAFYAAAHLPRRFIILCPNHTGRGHFAAINRDGSWRTPLGDVQIDEPLAADLMREAKTLRDDDAAHAREHSLEVQLPFLQRLAADFTFVPICLGAPRYELCEEVGHAVAAAVRAAGEPVGILASSDLNHYEDQETTLRKDGLAIDAVLALDPKRLWETVDENDISMCGYIPATTMLIAANDLGATTARLLKHATSGDVSGDYGHVVGYASIALS
ncbi:MAG TPA: AmmeMemoRadiSam system protein B [Thermoanaerobaculia bacterium]|nr:AmmeMemoRadiSam system protein B [Thermoanaerobaculia bacterium]